MDSGDEGIIVGGIAEVSQAISIVISSGKKSGRAKRKGKVLVLLRVNKC